MAPRYWPLSSWSGSVGSGLIEIDALAPAERLDVLERPPDRPVAHVDAADVAQIGLAWRACDRLQAGDDPRRAHFLARPLFGFLSAPFAPLSPLAPRSPRASARVAVGVPASSPISASHRVGERAAAEMHFERR